MADKYIKIQNGILTEQEATVISSGASNAGDIVALDSTGRLSETVLPVGIGADTATLPASENLSAGDFVNIFNEAGIAKVRKADASMYGKEAVGFVLQAVSSGNDATVYFEGSNTQLTGLTPGTVYYLSTTPGAVTSTPPSSSGNIVQRVGRSISSTTITFEPSDPVLLA